MPQQAIFLYFNHVKQYCLMLGDICLNNDIRSFLLLHKEMNRNMEPCRDLFTSMCKNRNDIMSLCCQTCCQTKAGICEKHVRRSYDIVVGFSHAYL